MVTISWRCMLWQPHWYCLPERARCINLETATDRTACLNNAWHGIFRSLFGGRKGMSAVKKVING